MGEREGSQQEKRNTGCQCIDEKGDKDRRETDVIESIEQVQLPSLAKRSEALGAYPLEVHVIKD